MSQRTATVPCPGSFHVAVGSVLVPQTERDVSVRQRAVDLLYAMCDRSNAQQIVAEMLSYLETADYSIREEIVSSGGLCVVTGTDACVSQLRYLLTAFVGSLVHTGWKSPLL